MARKTYICTNQACSLGSRETPGRFAGGLSKEQATALTGDPEADHGQGICPNCGQRGKEE